MLALRVTAFAVALLATGCSTTLSTLQPAEPMKPLHVQANAALDVVVPVSRVVDAVDVTATLADEYRTDPGYKPTEAEQKQALGAAVGLGLSSPGVNPDLMLRMGIVKNLDVGLRWSAISAHADAKYRFLTTRDPTPEEEADDAKSTLGNGPDRGFQGSISVGVSKALYSGFIFDLLDQLKIDDYSRWNLEVPVIFGTRIKDFGHVWFGPKYIYSHYSLDASLQNVGIVPETSGSIHHLGGFGGIALGYKVFFLFAELTVAKMWAKPEILGQATDLGGITVMPAFGLMLRI